MEKREEEGQIGENNKSQDFGERIAVVPKAREKKAG